MTCECDFDCSGDPGRYFRSNHKTLCPIHDKCEVCDDALAVMITEGTKVCATCAVEEITVCPNCGWDAGFEESFTQTRQPHGETWIETRLRCAHCYSLTDEEEVNRINKERLEDIKRRLEEMGL